jgi:hypothetical protein
MTVRDDDRETVFVFGRARLLPSRACYCESIGMRGSAGASPSHKANSSRNLRAESRTAILHRKSLVGNFAEFGPVTDDNPASYAK